MGRLRLRINRCLDFSDVSFFLSRLPRCCWLLRWRWLCRALPARWFASTPSTGWVAPTLGGACSAAAALDGAADVEVSADGAHVYVAAVVSRTIVVFARNAITGALSLSSCVSDDLGGDAGGLPAQTECSAAQGLGDPAALAISPDGRHVYVASPNAGSLAAFARDPQSGELAQLVPGCLTDSSAPATDPQCVAGARLNGASDLALSSDGNHLYLAAPKRDAVVVLSRDSASGLVAPVAGINGCVGSLPVEAGCRHGEALARPQAIAITPAGRHLVAASGLGTLATVERQLAPVCVATSLVQVAQALPHSTLMWRSERGRPYVRGCRCSQQRQRDQHRSRVRASPLHALRGGERSRVFSFTAYSTEGALPE